MAEGHGAALNERASEAAPPAPQRGLGGEGSKRGLLGECAARLVAGCLLPICWCCVCEPCTDYIERSGVEGAAQTIGGAGCGTST